MITEGYPRGVIFDLQGTLLVDRDGSDCMPRTDLRAGLQLLRNSDVEIGIITSNTEHDAKRLLDIVEVAHLFNPEYILGRDSRRPKAVTEQVRERRVGWSGKLLHIGSLVSVTVMREAKILEKPSTEPVEYLLDQWGIKAFETVYVGDDAEVDRLYAQSAGTNFAHIPPLGARNHSLEAFVRTSILD